MKTRAWCLLFDAGRGGGPPLPQSFISEVLKPLLSSLSNSFHSAVREMTYCEKRDTVSSDWHTSFRITWCRTCIVLRILCSCIVLYSCIGRLVWSVLRILYCIVLYSCIGIGWVECATYIVFLYCIVFLYWRRLDGVCYVYCLLVLYCIFVLAETHLECATYFVFLCYIVLLYWPLVLAWSVLRILYSCDTVYCILVLAEVAWSVLRILYSCIVWYICYCIKMVSDSFGISAVSRV